MKLFPAICIILLSGTPALHAQLSVKEKDSLAPAVVSIYDGIDTAYVYNLPFAPGKKIYLVQGYNGWFSHQDECSVDFVMKKGSPVMAAREGVVSSLKEDSDKGGVGDKWVYDANYIIIRHPDGTYAGYWHLSKDGVLVDTGDTVKTGQQIALSGNTGYSTAPHLHFWVYGYNSMGDFVTIPTKFKTSKGNRFPKPTRFYKYYETTEPASKELQSGAY